MRIGNVSRQACLSLVFQQFKGKNMANHFKVKFSKAAITAHQPGQHMLPTVHVRILLTKFYKKKWEREQQCVCPLTCSVTHKCAQRLNWTHVSLLTAWVNSCMNHPSHISQTCTDFLCAGFYFGVAQVELWARVRQTRLREIHLNSWCKPVINTYCHIQQRLESKYLHLAHFSFNTHGSDRVNYNLPDRPAVDAVCPSAVDKDSAACTLLSGSAANAAFAWSETVARTEARNLPKRVDASLLGPGLTGRSVTPRKVGPFSTPVKMEKASLLCLTTYRSLL